MSEELLGAGIDFDMSQRKFIDVQIIYHRKEPRTLEAAYKYYCDKDLDNAHSAEADTIATYEVLKSQLQKYPDLLNDVDVLSKEFSSFNNNVDYAGRMVYDENGGELFNFGKHRGNPVAGVLLNEPSYYSWMLDGDFPLNTKQPQTKIRIREMNNK